MFFLIAFYRDLVSQEEKEPKSVFQHTIHKFLLNYVSIQGDALRDKILDIVLKAYRYETKEDKEIILNLWRSRRKALSLPKF